MSLIAAPAADRSVSWSAAVNEVQRQDEAARRVWQDLQPQQQARGLPAKGIAARLAEDAAAAPSTSDVTEPVHLPWRGGTMSQPWAGTHVDVCVRLGVDPPPPALPQRPSRSGLGRRAVRNRRRSAVLAARPHPGGQLGPALDNVARPAVDSAARQVQQGGAAVASEVVQRPQIGIAEEAGGRDRHMAFEASICQAIASNGWGGAVATGEHTHAARRWLPPARPSSKSPLVRAQSLSTSLPLPSSRQAWDGQTLSPLRGFAVSRGGLVHQDTLRTLRAHEIMHVADAQVIHTRTRRRLKSESARPVCASMLLTDVATSTARAHGAVSADRWLPARRHLRVRSRDRVHVTQPCVVQDLVSSALH
jgi:hypothetical protein